MKKMNLITKLVVTSIVFAGIFFGGSYFAQNKVEKQVEKEVTQKEEMTEEEIAEAIAATQKQVEEIDNMSVKEYYLEYLNNDSKIITMYNEKFGEAASDIKNKELTKEQRDYLGALGYLVEHSEQPILAKNESGVRNEENYSLELFIAEIMTMRPNKETEALFIKLCRQNNINPDGQIKDLTPELIVEMTNQLFELEKGNH